MHKPNPNIKHNTANGFVSFYYYYYFFLCTSKYIPAHLFIHMLGMECMSVCVCERVGLTWLADHVRCPTQSANNLSHQHHNNHIVCMKTCLVLHPRPHSHGVTTQQKLIQDSSSKTQPHRLYPFILFPSIHPSRAVSGSKEVGGWMFVVGIIPRSHPTSRGSFRDSVSEDTCSSRQKIFRKMRTELIPGKRNRLCRRQEQCC